MSWYAAYVVHQGHHELIGTLSVKDDAQLKDQRSMLLHGMTRIDVATPIHMQAAVVGAIQMHRVVVRLQEVWSEREILFRYVTVEDPDRPAADLHHVAQLLDPRLDWLGATFVPLGAPLVCEFCPD